MVIGIIVVIIAGNKARKSAANNDRRRLEIMAGLRSAVFGELITTRHAFNNLRASPIEKYYCRHFAIYIEINGACMAWYLSVAAILPISLCLSLERNISRRGVVSWLTGGGK